MQEKKPYHHEARSVLFKRKNRDWGRIENIERHFFKESFHVLSDCSQTAGGKALRTQAMPCFPYPITDMEPGGLLLTIKRE
eukprot:1143173-Pelagomonas_calceolata.AAC.3